MACGCYSTSNINCNIDAIVCQGYFVIAIPPNGITAISEQGAYGTASIYPGGYIIYEHTANNTSSDTVTYLNSYGNECTLSITVEETIPTNTQIITLSASGDCEIGTPTFTWHLPSGTTLDDGYNIHQQNINVIVPTFDINNPSATYVFTVDVCCDYCNNCCKCDTIVWSPPLCTIECGEDEVCTCSTHLCTLYNPETGNCEAICENTQTCCETTISGYTISIGEISVDCDVIVSGNEIQDLSLTIIPDITGITPDAVIWHFFNPDTQCNPGSLECIDFRNCIDNIVVDSDNIVGGISGYVTISIIHDNLVIDFLADYVQNHDGALLYITLEIVSDCGTAYRSFVIGLDLGGIVSPDCGPSGILTVITDQINDIPLCNESVTCLDTNVYYCAECCDTSDCYISGCDNSDYICQGNECYCIVGNELIPAPTDGTCCPECVSSTTLVNCYECINNVIVAPNITCPNGFIYSWDTCSCVANPCLINQCIVPDASLYCPDIVDCGCEEIGNTTICIPCNTVSCTASIDCPFGCACENGTCTDNPCADYQCNNPSSLTYCPPQENCGCDNDEICIPCNTVSCTGNIDCPYGCTCIDNECNGPCGTLQVNCDAYFLHHESDLTLSAQCSINGDSYLIIPSLALEPSFIFTNNNVTWWINTNNDANGWLNVTGTLNNNNASPAITIVNGQLKIFYASGIEYINIMCLVNGRKVWYRLNTVTEEGIGCAYADFQLGGAFLCGEIFTIESNSGINWSVDEWLVTSGNVTYSTLGEDAILVIECAGTETVGLSAEVSNGNCTITTCPTSYPCNCTGSKDCDLWTLNLHGNFNQDTLVWTVVVDVLYDGVTGFAWYDCALPSNFQFPTQYNCDRCGANPYESYYITNPTGDDLINSPTPPFCFNPTANNICTECLCGFTFYNAELFDYDGVQIKVIPTGINPQICFQTNIAGTNADGPCCVSGCLNLEFIPACNLIIQSANFDCVSYGVYTLVFDVVGSLGTISTVNINGISTPFTLIGNTVTTLVESNALQTITIEAIDTYDCSVITSLNTPCCEVDVKIEPIDCATFDPLFLMNQCQACVANGDNNGSGTIVAYDITILNIPTGYTLAYTSNDTLSTGIVNVVVTSENFVIAMTNPLITCENFEIYSLVIIDSNGCEIPITTQCSGQCYNGLWTSVGSKIADWDNINKTSWIDYKFIGIKIDNTLFTFAGNPIDLKAIVCQAHKDSMLGTYSIAPGCNNTTHSVLNCISTTANTNCYLNPSTCINNNLPSNVFKQYHNLIAQYLYDEWACKLYANGVSGTPTAFLNQINQFLTNLGYSDFNIIKLIIPSIGNGTASLPDTSIAPQSNTYKYMIISTERYPMGLITPIRTPSSATNPQYPRITIGCESGNCDGPSGITGYNCEDCTILVSNGEYVTSADCINQCPTGCEIIYNDILPDSVSYNVTTVIATAVTTIPTDLSQIIGNSGNVNVTNENYGTMLITFDNLSIASCANFLRAEIVIIGQPAAEGWANALNVGTQYAPIYGNESFNSVNTQYGMNPSASAAYYAPGSSVYIGYSHEFSYDTINNANSGSITTTLNVNLSGVTTNPNSWILELIGIGSLTAETQVDILESVTMTLYTDCSECPSGLSYWSCNNNCESVYIDGVYSTQEECLLDCINLSCSADIISVTSETALDLSEFNLRVRGTGWTDATAAQTYLNVQNPTMTVDNFLIQGDDIYLLVSGSIDIGTNTFTNHRFITEFEDLTGWINYINPYAFNLTSSLNIVILPAVEYFDTSAFYKSNVSYMEAPNLLYIGDYALSETNIVTGSFIYCLTANTGAFSTSPYLAYLDLPQCQVLGNKCLKDCPNLIVLNINTLLEMGTTTGYTQVFQNTLNPNLIITTSDVIENAQGLGIPDGDLEYYFLTGISNPDATTIYNNIIYLPLIL